MVHFIEIFLARVQETDFSVGGAGYNMGTSTNIESKVHLEMPA
jgi:hypothetical protein